MELSEYVTGIRQELASITRFAGAEMAEAARMLTAALEPAIRLTLLDVLTAAAAEITQEAGDIAVEVRLDSGAARFVVTAPPDGEHLSGDADVPDRGDEAGTARITLRLPEAVKARVEAAAAAAGLSVNSWLVRAAQRAAGDGQRPGRRGGPRVGQRITGYARS
jgi:hypothetical protein